MGIEEEFIGVPYRVEPDRILLSPTSHSIDSSFVRVVYDFHLAKSSGYFLALTLW